MDHHAQELRLHLWKGPLAQGELPDESPPSPQPGLASEESADPSPGPSGGRATLRSEGGSSTRAATPPIKIVDEPPGIVTTSLAQLPKLDYSTLVSDVSEVARRAPPNGVPHTSV